MSAFLHSQKGFVILLAIVISASILMIGAGIFGSAFKETILASTSTESQVAFFVADTGMECALYTEFIDAGVWERCAGEVIQGSVSTSNNCVAGSTTLCSYEFTYQLPGTPGCGKVSVERNTAQTGQSGGDGTSIIARGYNFCIERGGQFLPDTNNSTLVERRLEVWYPNVVAPEPDTESGGASGGGSSPFFNPGSTDIFNTSTNSALPASANRTTTGGTSRIDLGSSGSIR